MKAIRDLQNQFIDNIYNSAQPELLSKIKNGKAPAQELLGIYRNNLYSALGNALRLTYPRIYHIINADKFSQWSQEYIKKYRSQNNNLDDYGQNFGQFLKAQGEDFLANLAELEWLEHQSYLAADSQIIDILSLQNLAPEKLFDVKFKLQPACFLYSSNYNLLAKNNQPKLQQRSLHFLVYRENLEIKTIRIKKAEFNFLSGVSAGLNLYQIYQKSKFDIASCLQKYIANNVLAEFC